LLGIIFPLDRLGLGSWPWIVLDRLGFGSFLRSAGRAAMESERGHRRTDFRIIARRGHCRRRSIHRTSARPAQRSPTKIYTFWWCPWKGQVDRASGSSKWTGSHSVRERVHTFYDVLHHTSRGLAPHLENRLLETLDTEQSGLGVFGFGHAIGVEQQHVAWRERD
jgi:hypothetical protein